MTAGQAILDPAAPAGDAFLDALLGLDRVCRRLALVVDGAAHGGDAATPGDTVGPLPEPRGEVPDGLPESLPEGLIDAVLGLASLETTLSLVLEALHGEPAAAEPAVAAGWPEWSEWSRELLR